MAGISLNIRGAKVVNNTVNLCSSCRYVIPECKATFEDILFGDGIGNDNVCACRFYEARVAATSCGNCMYYDRETKECRQPNGVLANIEPDGFCSMGKEKRK